MNGDGLLWCLGSPYAETYREFIAFTTRLYDKVPSFSPPTLYPPSVFLHISLSVSMCYSSSEPCCLCYLVLFPPLCQLSLHFSPFHLAVSLFLCQFLSAFHRMTLSHSLSLTLPLSPLDSPCLPLSFILTHNAVNIKLPLHFSVFEADFLLTLAWQSFVNMAEQTQTGVSNGKWVGKFMQCYWSDADMMPELPPTMADNCLQKNNQSCGSESCVLHFWCLCVFLFADLEINDGSRITSVLYRADLSFAHISFKEHAGKQNTSCGIPAGRGTKKRKEKKKSQLFLFCTLFLPSRNAQSEWKPFTSISKHFTSMLFLWVLSSEERWIFNLWLCNNSRTASVEQLWPWLIRILHKVCYTAHSCFHFEWILQLLH